MISNGKDRPLSASFSSGLPDVASAVTQNLQPVKIRVIKKTQIAGYTQETFTEIKTMASRQPMRDEEIVIKPEGQRSWTWEKVHSLPDLNLKLDDIFIWNDIRYRVMSRRNWAQYGYVEYEVVSDFNRTSRL